VSARLNICCITASCLKSSSLFKTEVGQRQGTGGAERKGKEGKGREGKGREGKGREVK
jgi:hypothetical protein